MPQMSWKAKPALQIIDCFGNKANCNDQAGKMCCLATVARQTFLHSYQRLYIMKSIIIAAYIPNMLYVAVVSKLQYVFLYVYTVAMYKNSLATTNFTCLYIYQSACNQNIHQISWETKPAL